MVYDILKKLVTKSKDGHDPVFVLTYVFSNLQFAATTDRVQPAGSKPNACLIQDVYKNDDTVTLEIEAYVDGVSDDLEHEIDPEALEDQYTLEHDVVDGNPAWILCKPEIYAAWKKRHDKPISEELEHGLLTDQILKLWSGQSTGGAQIFFVVWWADKPGTSMTSHAFEVVKLEVVAVAGEKNLKIWMRDLSNSTSVRTYTLDEIEDRWELEHRGDHWVFGPGAAMKDYMLKHGPHTGSVSDKMDEPPSEPVKEHMLTNESVLVEVINKLLHKWTEGGPAVYTDMLGRDDVQVTDIEVVDWEVKMTIVYDYKEETVNVELASFDESFDLDKTAHGSWMMRFREATN